MRYSFGGDEHIFIEVDEAMSLDACFKSLYMTNAVRESRIPGVTEICPANASLMIKFDPEILALDNLLTELKGFESSAGSAAKTIETRIIEIPVLYNDPWTLETQTRFRERRHEPSSTDLEFSARLNNYPDVDSFIAAHAASPWFVSMVGFVAGLPFTYQLVERSRQIEAPKYLRPRIDTPPLTIGHGGCFGCIYSVRGAGGYQMFGVTPMPIYDPGGKVSYLQDLILFRPGDIIKFRAVDRTEYDTIVSDIEVGRFEPRIVPTSFSLEAFVADSEGTNAKLLESLNG